MPLCPAISTSVLMLTPQITDTCHYARPFPCQFWGSNFGPRAWQGKPRSDFGPHAWQGKPLTSGATSPSPPLTFLYTFPRAYLESQWNSLQANVRERVRAPLHTAQVTCLMLSLGNQRHACIAFDILLLELIRCLIIINTVFFRCCLLLILPLLLYTLVSFKPSIVFWLL